MEEKRFGRAVWAGIAGMVVMSVLMIAAPKMGFPPMNLPQTLGMKLGVGTAGGWIVHLLLGIILALIYVYVFKGVLPGTGWKSGAVYGLIPWVVAGFVVNPWMGGGLFGAKMGGFMMVLGGLMGHLVYGAVMGGVYGEPLPVPSAPGAEAAPGPTPPPPPPPPKVKPETEGPAAGEPPPGSRPEEGEKPGGGPEAPSP